MTASHLEFYTKHQISPVRQDIQDLPRHFRRREGLYRQLGIAPATMQGKRVAEVGPGSGHNALYTASLKPAAYTLIEGNPRGVSDTRALISQFPDFESVITIAESSLENYCGAHSEQFDFVICEGVLSGVPNPETLLSGLSDMTKPGGLLLVSCVDHASHFAEIVRRLIGQLVIDPQASIDDQVETMLPIFESHLANLTGMSRRQDDWIIDNLIHPGSIIPLINMAGLIEFLDKQFDFHGSSPRFVSDWRWYKDLTGSEFQFNQLAISQYWQNVHNMMDFQRVYSPISVELGKNIYTLCSQIRDLIQIFEATRDSVHVERIRPIFAKLIDLISPCASDLGTALGEAYRLIWASNGLDVNGIRDSRKFGQLFGRGTQYISLLKRAP